MSHLVKTAKRARLRLWLNRWLSKLGWTLAGASLLFVVVVLIDRLWLVRPDGDTILGWTCLALLGASVVAAVIWTLLTRESLATAAAALDEAAGLKERVSTAVYCAGIDDPFAQAVVADAHRVTHGLTVRRHLPLRVPYSANYAGPMILMAFLIFWLLPVVDLAGKQELRNKQREEQNRIAKLQAVVQPVLDKQVESFRQKYPKLDPEMEELVALKGAAPTTRPEDVKNEAIKEINNLVRKTEERKDDPDLARIEEFRKIAQRLEAQHRGNNLVAKLAQAMAQGDYQSAQKALEEMKLDLMKAPTTEEQKKKTEELRGQMNKLAAQLQQLAQNDKKLQNELAKAGLKPDEVKRALEHLAKNQDFESLKKELAKKGMSQQQIDKLVNQLQKCQGGSKMADNLAQSLQKASQSQQGSQGQQGSDALSDSAQAGFSEAAEQLSEMESLQQELNQLSSAAAELKQMQDQLARAGQGQGQGQGMGDGMGDGEGMGEDEGLGRGGWIGGGMGSLGIGQGGVAPKTETGGRTAAQKAKVNTLPGAIISTQFVNGEQIKGEATAQFVEAVISAQRDIADAIGREAIPRQYHKSVSKYFSQATEGLPAEKVKAAEARIDENKAEDSNPAPEAK